MTKLNVRDLDEDVIERLRVRAARNGRSLEAEVRAILEEALSEPGEAPKGSEPAEDYLFSALRKRFQELGGVELDLPPRSTEAHVGGSS